VILGFVTSVGLLSGMAIAEVCATDDRNREVCLEQPAERIATLSPGATELTYAAGAGDKVVAVVSYSDYPPEAKEVASVGSHTRMDLEALVTLRPDLVIGWVTGNPAEQLETIEALGIPVFYIEQRRRPGGPGVSRRHGRPRVALCRRGGGAGVLSGLGRAADDRQ
jgi:iron complex transport system substrate-binding protein